MSTETYDPSFEALLTYVKHSRRFDFSAYKRTTLRRRIDKRLGQLRITDYDDYIDHLQVHADEFGVLFDTVMINVTEFLRDPSVWRDFAETVIPKVMSQRDDDQPIRIWSAGCATGEEPYTLAMVLADILGEQVVRDRVKIYATDVDEEALTIARSGTYDRRALDNLTSDAIERHFDHLDGEGDHARYAFAKPLRRSIIFGRHDLLSDAPISRLDLLLCRNTLMYFNAKVQGAVLDRFHFALRPHGVLLSARPRPCEPTPRCSPRSIRAAASSAGSSPGPRSAGPRPRCRSRPRAGA